MLYVLEFNIIVPKNNVNYEEVCSINNKISKQLKINIIVMKMLLYIKYNDKRKIFKSANINF